MQRTKIVTGLSLIIIAMLCGTGQVFAKNGALRSAESDKSVDHVDNSHRQRQETPHSQKKMAARRLRLDYRADRQQQMDNWVKSHHGYTGQGRTGDVSLIKEAHKRQGGSK